MSWLGDLALAVMWVAMFGWPRPLYFPVPLENGREWRSDLAS